MAQCYDSIIGKHLSSSDAYLYDCVLNVDIGSHICKKETK